MDTTPFTRIDPADFCTRWQAWYPGTVPLGYRMREAHPARWLRVHSLPGAKRYAGSAAEKATLLARQNRAAHVVLGERPTVALLGYDLTGRYTLPPDHPLRELLLPDAPPVMRLAPDDEEGEATSIFGALRTWRSGDLDEVLLAVADDQFRLLVLNWETGTSFAPYDGGADLFFASPEDRESARPSLVAWLSGRPDGL
jgi:hypothetical protein